MEDLVKKLEVPLLFIAIIMVLFLIAKVAEAYNNYWQGQLARKKFESNIL